MTRKEALALYEELHDLGGVKPTPDVKARLKAIAFKFRRAEQSLTIAAGRAVRAMGGEGVWNRLESLRQAIEEAWPEEKAD